MMTVGVALCRTDDENALCKIRINEAIMKLLNRLSRDLLICFVNLNLYYLYKNLEEYRMLNKINITIKQ